MAGKVERLIDKAQHVVRSFETQAADSSFVWASKHEELLEALKQLRAEWDLLGKFVTKEAIQRLEQALKAFD